MPRQNDSVNEEWLSDKARFQYDGLKRQRLGVPMVKGEDGGLRAASWLEALQAVAAAMQGVPGDRMLALAGARASDRHVACADSAALCLKVIHQTFGYIWEHKAC